MNGNKILKIFMHPREFPCGEQSSCCGPVGQSEEEIQLLKSSIEDEMGYQVEVLNVKNEEQINNYPQVVKLVHSLGPAALPILTLEDEVVSVGNTTPEAVLAAIREKTLKKKSGKDNETHGHENPEQADGQESTGNAQACCPSADGSESCCQPDSKGISKRGRTAIFIFIVLAAGVVLARSLLIKPDSSTSQAESSFVTIQLEAKSNTPSPVNPTAKKEIPAKSQGVILLVKDTTGEGVFDKTASALWEAELGSLASLNKVATNTDAVFVLLAAEDQQGSQTITKEIDAAVKKIKSNGVRISVFRLKQAVPDYAQLAKQFSVPCVLAMVKGRGMSAVSGEISEANLIQAFVAASRPTSGCCPSGAGASSCP